MKLIQTFLLILVININYNFGQQINDSIAISSPDKGNNNGLLGYGSIISHDDFKEGAVFSPMLLIQGKVPGFVVNFLNVNDPNPDLQIQLRGTSTLFLSTVPLYIIDGIPMESADIIPTENIESIEVLKSLAETAQYGIRGSNGVVIIKTKSSSSQKLAVTYNTYLYGEAFAKKTSYLSASEWRNLKQNWASSTFPILIYGSEQMNDYNANTDWRKEISQNKLSQAHNLGFFGNYKKTRYSAMVNYNNYNGILQKTSNTSYSAQFVVSQLALKDKLQVDLSVIGTYKKYSEINDNPYMMGTNSNTGLKSSNIVSFANHYNPTIPVYNTDGTYGMDTTYNNSNPVNKLNNISDKRELKNTLVHLQASYEIIEGLKFSASLSEYKMASDNSFSNYYQYVKSHQNLAETKENNEQKERIYSLKLRYSKSIAFHYFDVLLDYSKQRSDINYDYRDSLVTNGTDLISRSWSFGDLYYNFENLSGSVKYNYKDKYYLSLGILKETSPFYTTGESAQYFPSLSAAWSLGNENFLTSITWLNEFKIRAGYGVGQRMIKFAGDLVNESMILPSNNVRGETLKEFNVGIDASLLSNRVLFSVDYYSCKTKEGILPVSGQYFSYLINETKIKNKGWEFYIKAQPLISILKWTFDFNISFNTNILTSDVIYTNSIKLKDQPVGNFYGHKFAGYSATNQILFYDNNGNTTTDRLDYNKIGNGVPKSFFGFTNTFVYKNFDLSVFVRGALGFDIKNLKRMEYLGNVNYNKIVLSDDPRNIANYSRLESTDFYIEKGNYAKIDYITLGYTIPIENQIIKSAKVYVACNNVAIFTKFSDGDPEMAGITGLYPGYYYYQKYPETRIFLLGLKVLF